MTFLKELFLTNHFKFCIKSDMTRIYEGTIFVILFVETIKNYKSMKSIKANLIKKVIGSENLQNTGIVISSFFETYKEFINRWFGLEDDSFEMTGSFQNNSEYIWSAEILENVPDMIINIKGRKKLYFFLIEE